MTGLDRLVNACLCPGFAGEWLLRAVDEGLGGVCIYGRHADELRSIAPMLRERRDDLLVAVDEEGGDVTRLHYRIGSPVPGNLALGAVDDVELTRSLAGAIAGELATVGFNWNLAPVVDANTDPDNPVIGPRSFGSDPELVARHGRAFVEGTQAEGVAATAKHFPGHGATRTDSHHGLPVIDCDLSALRARELVPFAAAIEAGVRSVMTAHIVFPQLDDAPATTSRPILTDLLRGELGFEGVIVTDALEMGAVADRWPIEDVSVRALAAGADLLLLGEHDAERDCAAIRVAVAEAVRAGDLPLARLEEAAARVRELGEWASRPRRGGEALEELGREAARRALRCEGALPLAEPPFVVELRGRTSAAVGETHWSLAEPLAELGFLAGSATVTEATAGDPLPETSAPLVAACRDAYRIPWQREWLEHARPEVVVALGLPDDRELARAAFIATHGAARASTRAAAQALSGR